MKVRTLALGVLASVLMPATAQAAAVVLKVAHFLPPASPAHTRFIVPWEVVPATKAHELTKFHVEVSGGRSLTTATSIYVMNQKRYDSLPPELKKVIDDNSGREVSAWVAAEFKVGDEGGRAAALGRGNKITEIPADEVKRWRDASQPVVDEWIAEVTSKGHDGRKLYERAVELVEKYSRN